MGVILSACYALWLYRRVVFGKLEKSSLAHIVDMTPREVLTLAPLVVLTIFFGVYPSPILDVFGATVENLMKTVQSVAMQ
jgi:NADH-quinone oxidoreductase subunit M